MSGLLPVHAALRQGVAPLQPGISSQRFFAAIPTPQNPGANRLQQAGTAHRLPASSSCFAFSHWPLAPLSCVGFLHRVALCLCSPSAPAMWPDPSQAACLPCLHQRCRLLATRSTRLPASTPKQPACKRQTQTLPLRKLSKFRPDASACAACQRPLPQAPHLHSPTLQILL